MDEYIKRDDALLAISYYPIENPEPDDIIQAILETARKLIARINAADVSPVRHGRWIEYIEIGAMNNHYECSTCHWKTPSFTIARESNFCPNCGAKMDLEE